MNKYSKIITAFFAPILITGCSSSDVKNVATFPKYGNYCGLDRPANKELPETIDKVDLACKNHDKCYDERGDFNVVCDTTLIAELKNMTPETEPERIARKLIISYFRNSPQKHLMEINLDDIKL
jgi:Phospholipase A2